MDSIVKPYLFKASVLAFIALLLGIILSVLVYFATEKVRENASVLVEHRIPILTSINQIIADINEQERILFEYYATQDQNLFWQNYNENKAVLTMHITSLSGEEKLVPTVQLILTTQARLEQLIMTFHQAMQLNEDNWNYLRELLTQISTERQNLLPALKKVEAATEDVVAQSHSNTLSQMDVTRQVVIFYCIGIVLLAAIVARYIQKFMLINAQNNRLALFSQRNPHPILSIDANGTVSYKNPACNSLLTSVGLTELDIHQLIPQNFSVLREQMSAQKQYSLSTVQPLLDRQLQLNINWLREIDAFDVHVHDITEQKLAENRVQNLAFNDQKTGLPNFYKLNEVISNFIEQDYPFMLGLLSIRHFERLISAVGVEASDELMVVLAKLFDKHSPSDVLIFQINQSQFALLQMTDSPYLSAQVQQKRMSELVESSIVTASGEFFVELDFGFSFYPEHSNSKEGLYQNALTALAVASSDEHLSSVIFEPVFAQAILHKTSLIDNLRYALEREELYLVFQPQLSLFNNKISGVETLVRWQHDGDIVSPADFIPLAEQSGLIVPIGTWILEQACRFAKQLVANGNKEIIVAVNVSPRQFTHPGFTQTVMKVLADTKLPATNLELEITEGVFLHNEDNTLSVLNQLKSLGVHLSIDDFGTGYSSLSYLKKFPVDKLKIDQAFIRDSHNNEDDKVLVKTIIALGHSLGMSIIAEGVELEAHRDYLKQMGCDEIQGYWFSKPQKADELLHFMTNHERDVNISA